MTPGQLIEVTIIFSLPIPVGIVFLRTVRYLFRTKAPVVLYLGTLIAGVGAVTIEFVTLTLILGNFNGGDNTGYFFVDYPVWADLTISSAAVLAGYTAGLLVLWGLWLFGRAQARKVGEWAERTGGKHSGM